MRRWSLLVGCAVVTLLAMTLAAAAKADRGAPEMRASRFMVTAARTADAGDAGRFLPRR